MVTSVALSAATKTQILTGAYFIKSLVYIGATTGTANAWDSASTTVTNSVGDYDKKTVTNSSGTILTNTADQTNEGITYAHTYSGISIADSTQAAQANKALPIISTLPTGAVTVNDVDLNVLFGLVVESTNATTLVVEYFPSTHS